MLKNLEGLVERCEKVILCLLEGEDTKKALAILESMRASDSPIPVPELPELFPLSRPTAKYDLYKLLVNLSSTQVPEGSQKRLREDIEDLLDRVKIRICNEAIRRQYVSDLTKYIATSSDVFGGMLEQAWGLLAAGCDFSEVQLFRSLRSALLTLSPPFGVEEFHGNKHQVGFAGAGFWGRPLAKCELSDLMIVAFKTRPRFEARLTFLQAKRSTGEHDLSGEEPVTTFKGNLEQWDLLQRRPAIEGLHAFTPPRNLLSGSILPSVGSFGVFYRSKEEGRAFFFTSADALRPRGQPTSKHATLELIPGTCERTIRGFPECRVACSIKDFGRSLYLRKIGTPIEGWSAISREDGDYRRVVRKWLSCLLVSGLAKGSERPVARLLLRSLNETDERIEEENVLPRVPRIVLIRTDEDYDWSIVANQIGRADD